LDYANFLSIGMPVNFNQNDEVTSASNFDINRSKTYLVELYA